MAKSITAQWMPTKQESALLGALALFMLATRFHHFGTPFHLPDASYAVFFLGGFYLRRIGFMPLLAGEAVLLDYVGATYAGVSNWCLTPAYCLLGLSYLVLWTAGSVCRRSYNVTLGFVAWFSAGALASTSAAYLISDGAFYWLSGRVAAPTWSGYWLHMSEYFVSYVSIACAYIAAVAIIHAATVTFTGSQARRHAA